MARKGQASLKPSTSGKSRPSTKGRVVAVRKASATEVATERIKRIHRRKPGAATRELALRHMFGRRNPAQKGPQRSPDDIHAIPMAAFRRTVKRLAANISEQRNLLNTGKGLRFSEEAMRILQIRVEDDLNRIARRAMVMLSLTPNKRTLRSTFLHAAAAAEDPWRRKAGYNNTSFVPSTAL